MATRQSATDPIPQSGSDDDDRQPLLLVHSLVSKSYIFDLVEGNSVVEALTARGFDVYLTDWGVPDELEANNTLETYADYYLPRMVRAACRASGSEDLNLLGYCFGGVLSLLYAAGHPHDPVRSFAFVATPWTSPKWVCWSTWSGRSGSTPTI